MTLLNKFSMAAITTVATFLAIGAVGKPAEATLYKYTFRGEGASGYFIFDDTIQKSIPDGQPSTELSWEYYGSIVKYSVNFAGSDGEITEKGERGSQANITDEARNVVYLERPESTGYEGTKTVLSFTYLKLLGESNTACQFASVFQREPCHLRVIYQQAFLERQE